MDLTFFFLSQSTGLISILVHDLPPLQGFNGPFFKPAENMHFKELISVLTTDKFYSFFRICKKINKKSLTFYMHPRNLNCVPNGILLLSPLLCRTDLDGVVLYQIACCHFAQGK